MSQGTKKKERYTSNNSVHLLQSGERFFSALELLIREAKEEIHFQTYILADDETGQRIANALMEAARHRNVKVYLLVDAYGSQQLSTAFIRELEDSGIEFRKYGQFYSHGNLHIGRRLHRKVVVADGHVSIVGGINISNNYNDRPGFKAWLDFAVLVKGSASRRLQLICRQRWLNIRFKRFSKRILKPHLASVHHQSANTLVRVSQNDFIRRKNEVAIAYRQAIRQSMHSLLIVGGYFLPGGQVRRLLREASRRNVVVCILVPENSDVKPAIYARQYLYDWLLRNKIRIYEYLPSNVHGKMLIADSKFVSIGSYDLNNLSTYSNIELNLDIRDDSFSLKCENLINEIIKNDCKLITKEDFERQITWLHRLRNWFSYRFVKTFFVLALWFANKKERDY